jgi:hypothetical protein
MRGTVQVRIEDPTPMLTAHPINSGLCNAAHKHASRHREEIQASTRCACFFCFRTFPHTEIKSWIDANQTALCPRCGVDSVLGSASNHRLDDAFLRNMHTHFFTTGRR